MCHNALNGLHVIYFSYSYRITFAWIKMFHVYYIVIFFIPRGANCSCVYWHKIASYEVAA